MDQDKLFNLIINSEDRQAMIDCLIEEKIRSIFYGNPADIFINDKCKLELGNTFKDKYNHPITLYREIVGRRNVIIHNAGRVDKKYLKENRQSNLAENQAIIITEDYLRGTIGILIGISAIATKCVIEKIYKGECRGELATAIATFDMGLNSNWYDALLKCEK